MQVDTSWVSKKRSVRRPRTRRPESFQHTSTTHCQLWFSFLGTRSVRMFVEVCWKDSGRRVVEVCWKDSGRRVRSLRTLRVPFQFTGDQSNLVEGVTPTHINIYIHAHLYIFVCMYVWCMYVLVCVCVRVCVYVCVCACACAYVCVCACLLTRVFAGAGGSSGTVTLSNSRRFAAIVWFLKSQLFTKFTIKNPLKADFWEISSGFCRSRVLMKFLKNQLYSDFTW